MAARPIMPLPAGSEVPGNHQTTRPLDDVSRREGKDYQDGNTGPFSGGRRQGSESQRQQGATGGASGNGNNNYNEIRGQIKKIINNNNWQKDTIIATVPLPELGDSSEGLELSVALSNYYNGAFTINQKGEIRIRNFEEFIKQARLNNGIFNIVADAAYGFPNDNGNYVVVSRVYSTGSINYQPKGETESRGETGESAGSPSGAPGPPGERREIEAPRGEPAHPGGQSQGSVVSPRIYHARPINIYKTNENVLIQAKSPDPVGSTEGLERSFILKNDYEGTFSVNQIGEVTIHDFEKFKKQAKLNGGNFKLEVEGRYTYTDAATGNDVVKSVATTIIPINYMPERTSGDEYDVRNVRLGPVHIAEKENPGNHGIIENTTVPVISGEDIKHHSFLRNNYNGAFTVDQDGVVTIRDIEEFKRQATLNNGIFFIVVETYSYQENEEGTNVILQTYTTIPVIYLRDNSIDGDSKEKTYFQTAYIVRNGPANNRPIYIIETSMWPDDVRDPKPEGTELRFGLENDYNGAFQIDENGAVTIRDFEEFKRQVKLNNGIFNIVVDAAYGVKMADGNYDVVRRVFQNRPVIYMPGDIA